MKISQYFKSEPHGWGSFFKSANNAWEVVQLLEKRANVEIATGHQFQIGARYPSTEHEYNTARAVALIRLGLHDMAAEQEAQIAEYEEREANRYALLPY